MVQNYSERVAHARETFEQAKANALLGLADTCRMYVAQLMERGYTARVTLTYDRGYGYFLENGTLYVLSQGSSYRRSRETASGAPYTRDDVKPEEVLFHRVPEEQLLRTARELERILGIQPENTAH